MIQVLKSRSFGEDFGNALGAGLGQGLETARKNASDSRRMAQENEAIHKLTGLDMSGIQDPKVRAKAYEMATQGAQQERMLALKGQQKQDFLSQIFGGQPPGQQQSPQDMLADAESQGMQQQGQSQGMLPQGFDASSITDAQIAQASAVDPNIGRSLQHSKDVALREKREQAKMDFAQNKLTRHEDFEIIKPVIQELSQVRKNIPFQEQAIEDIKNAAPDVGWRDYIADVAGFEPGRTAEGAKLKTALKDFFLSDLTRAGSRPNQWIEQQLSDALPKLGRSPEANLIVAEGMSFKVDLAKKRMEIMDDLIEKDRQKYGYVKPDIDTRSYKLLKPFVEQRKKDMIDTITDIKKKNKPSKSGSSAPKGFTRMQNPETGEVFEILNGHVGDAEEAGWLAQ
jgi:hypothetical protein